MTSAFAQPAKPGPDGWATGSGGSPLPAAGANAAAPVQPAPGPPGTVPSRPAVIGGGASDAGEPGGPFVAGSLGFAAGPFAMADLQLGWRIGAWFSPFVSLSGVVVLDDDDGGGGVRLTGVGARLWFDRAFVEGRVMQAGATSGCDFDEPCTEQTVHLGMFGVGGVIGGRHVGLELRASVLTDGKDAVFLGTAGLGFYL
ncbi:MAG TPA: hypothetical protein VF469_33475 [Kofleriaceae bacterium]